MTKEDLLEIPPWLLNPQRELPFVEYDAALAARDMVEQMVADGELCSVDGEPCDFQTHSYKYGEDRDGNRGIWVQETACVKCGEPPHD